MSAAPTFNRDIAPIIYRACTPCHRAGQAAPFVLLDYDDVKRRARLIAQVTRERVMPPWQPDAGHGDFVGARRLSAHDLDAIAQWVDAGAPEGRPADRPEAPRWTDGWTLGPPDAVVRLTTPYSLPSSGRDQVRTVVVPTNFSERRYVRALDFHPGGTTAIHHANIKVDAAHSSRWLDAEDPDAGYEGAGGRGAGFPAGHFLGWTVGQSARLTDRAPWTLEAGADIVIEIHLTPTGKPETIQPMLGLYFTDRAEQLPPYMIRLGRQDLDIPAGAAAHRAVDAYVLPTDVTLVAVQPHAHNRATEVRAYATLPDGSVTPLLRISRWNPRWQDVYQYVQPVFLPKGTTLAIEYQLDNSASNPRNPFSPPRRATFGQAATSEMADVWFQVVTSSADARGILDRDYSPKMLREDIAGAETVLEANPQDPHAHTDLAYCYSAAGRVDDAMVHLRAAVQLAPASAGARFDLAVALIRGRRFDEARQHLTEAIRVKPDFAAAYSNLGVVSHAQGQLADALDWYARALALNAIDAQTEYNIGRAQVALGAAHLAVPHYEASLTISPDDPLTLVSLGSALAQLNRLTDAVVQYRRALTERPDFVPALVDLAWILATSGEPVGDPREGVALARRAVALTSGGNATILDTLAAAYAAESRFGDAATAAKQALALARAEGDAALADRISLRLAYYERHVAR